ncbi:MAG: methylated-DNA--[protein]-cysteine S-methyltransferase, partial [Chitinophagaceae bacterium]
ATANGMNALAILIPCHRVVGTNSALTGYSGGLAAKKWLLEHERKNTGLATQPLLF